MKWFIKEVLLTWYAIAWVFVILIIVLVSTGRVDLNSVKAGSFEVTLEKKAKDLGVSNTAAFKNIKNLNEDELKLFLVMGGADAKYYVFTNHALSKEASNDIYLKLQADSLMKIRVFGKKGDSTEVFPTEIGKNVHRALIQSIYYQLNK